MAKIEYLKNMTAIFCDTDFLIDSDGPLLASFIRKKNGIRLLDLCSGNGIIPIWLIDRGFKGEVVSIDIQQEAILLLNQTIKENQLSCFTAICQDLKTYTSPIKFDIICCNPPYYSLDRYPSSANIKRRISRSFLHASIEDVVDCVKRNLKDNGSFWCCFPPTEKENLFSSLFESNLYPKRIRYIRFNPSHSPWLILVESGFGENRQYEELPDLIAEEDGIRNIDFDDIFMCGKANP